MPAAIRGAALSRAARNREIETPSGPARAVITGPGRADLAVLGHGAGGGIDAPDLVAVTERLVDLGWTVARVEQPYRVKGRRAPEAAPRLDAAWSAVVTALRAGHSGRLLVAGRSSGARVAVRTAAELAADLIVALAFPLHPPGKPEKTRMEELAQLPAPMLIVQGERDPFGAAAEFPPGPQLTSVPGDHSLRQAPDQVAAAVADWLAGIGR
ncbi:MAG TPA: alpha/beta family hydrolase [Mycobacteriales bacterium]|nr:alpha/beta family hydrolase [Mycobacteriales bacterium]